jgi:hypothetical protein
MPSSLTRQVLVETAAKQAGRSAEIYAHSKLLLNNLLRANALQRRYRVLKKVGTAITLPQGSDTAVLPEDFGAAFESLNPENSRNPLIEFEMDDFIERGGMFRSGSSTGEPLFYTVDREASLIRFNCPANKNFSYIPVYYKLPAPYALDSSADNTKVWYEDDLTLIEGLMAYIFQYTDDQRHIEQLQKFDVLDSKYRAGTQPIQGGSSKIRLASSTFRTRGVRHWR